MRGRGMVRVATAQSLALVGDRIVLDPRSLHRTPSLDIHLGLAGRRLDSFESGNL